MKIDTIKQLAEKKGLSIKKIEELCGLGNGIIGKWSKQSPNCDNIYKVAELLETSIDYLYTGKEKSSSPDLSEEEQEFLQKFKNLSPVDQGRILERMETMLNSYAPEQKENVS